ncbi:MAG: arsenosugar biosynthesis radical SAM protein ArsS [Acidobacteriota bacterium]|jgi:radical SAM/Cys-rich protein
MSDPLPRNELPRVEPFSDRLEREGLRLERGPVETVQVNVGLLCNQACHHCHVDAGPRRVEQMDGRTARRVLELLARTPGVRTLDLTGGAPELNPWFRLLVGGGRELGVEVIDRSNLTVLLEPGQEDLPELLSRHGVRIVASLPCYTRENVDGQRGRGVFEKSVKALRLLNEHGYGRDGGELRLDLVYNPGGPHLPGDQEALERDYKARLWEDHGIEFDRLLTLANLPIHRFRDRLERDGRLSEYMELLAESFNPATVPGLMCRGLVSVGWNGHLYDCDFNQVLELPAGGRPRTVWDLESFSELDGGPIARGDHCYGCTAGRGSSCGGALS